ncbi:MAG: AMP-binding protein [Propylenella sp.]
MLGPSAHIDTFTRANLPPPETWPEFVLSGFDYPEFVNAAVELTDRIVEGGLGDNIALIGQGRMRTYKELADWTSRLARVLVEDLGIEPGNRVLIRSANTPAMVACWLAALKAGAVVINTLPDIRAAEIAKVVDKTEAKLALCDTRLMDELVTAAKSSRFLKKVIGFDGTANFDAELDRLALGKPVRFEAVHTGRDDVAIIAFSTGATGEPRAAMHFHRDLLAIADGYAKEVLGIRPDDIVVGTPPLAFTFGLGGLVAFPLRFGAASVLIEDATPADLVAEIKTYKATISVAGPSVYQRILALRPSPADLASLRLAVSAGEALPAKTFEAWTERTGIPILDGIGGTEMLHIFISNHVGDAAAGAAGRPVAGYEARVVDDSLQEKPRGEIGQLVVRGPTGCRYLADARQTDFVRDGWNVTGDMLLQDEEGRFRFVARADDIIVTDGERVAAPEVEAALKTHPSVADCAVVGIPDRARGQIVKAFVVLAPGETGSAASVKRLQDRVKEALGPEKYPRSVRFVDALPKTATGKVRRFLLRQVAR